MVHNLFIMKASTDTATYRYIDHAQRAPRLSREEEQALVARWSTSQDRRAADQLVGAHLRDVCFIAMQHRFYGMPIGDLIAEGNLGLLKALEKYDPAFGTRFGTYAAYWVRAFIIGHVLRSWSMVGNRTGVLRTKLFFRLRRERARLENLHGVGEQAEALLAERMDVSRERLGAMIRRVDARDVSLDAPLRDDSHSTLGDSIPGEEDQERTYQAMEVRERLEAALKDALPGLDPRERFIVEARWLADGEDELSLADIGRRFGVSRERARQLETRARQKLQRALRDRHGATPDWLEAATAA
jgi:RNA polymerase sigma-32 factor